MADTNPAPTPPPAPQDELTKQWDDQRKIIQARNALLLAQMPLLDKVQADPYGKAAEGKVELAGVEIEVYLTTMQAIAKAANTLGEELRAYKDFKANEYGKTYPLKTLLIYNEQDATAVRQYRVFELFTQTIRDTYTELLGIEETPPPLKVVGSSEILSLAPALTPALAIKGVGLALQSVGNILSFFRTDVKVTGVKVEATESALVAAFVKALHSKTTQSDALTVYYPALFPLETSPQAVGLTRRLEELFDLRQQSAEKLQKLQQLLKPPPHAVALIAELKKANTAYDKFIGDLLTPSANGDMNNLLMLFRAATLQEKLDGGAHWLHLQVQKAGGNLVTKTGGLLGRSDFVCRGGVVVSYLLVDPDMTIVRSGDVVGYTRYEDLDDLEKSLQS